MKLAYCFSLGNEVIMDAIPRPIVPFGEKAAKIDLMKPERMNGTLTYISIYRR